MRIVCAVIRHVIDCKGAVGKPCSAQWCRAIVNYYEKWKFLPVPKQGKQGSSPPIRLAIQVLYSAGNPALGYFAELTE